MKRISRALGYNEDGSINEKEAEIVKYIFEATNSYYENPPQELLEWAREEYEGADPLPTEEELVEKARLLVIKYVAKEVNEKFANEISYKGRGEHVLNTDRYYGYYSSHKPQMKTGVTNVE